MLREKHNTCYAFSVDLKDDSMLISDISISIHDTIDSIRFNHLKVSFLSKSILVEVIEKMFHQQYLYS